MSSSTSPYFSRVLKPYCSLPAESGSKDQALLTLARRIDLSQPRLLLDYGCGRGRLLAALCECRSPLELACLHYIGVDLHEDALKKAQEFFDSAVASTGARACFLPHHSFLRFVDERLLVDQIAVVFAVHEFDPANLDYQLAGLWRILRRGGRLHVQDTGAAIHEEVEFLALPPDCVKQILEEAGAYVTIQMVTAGRRAVPVYLIEAHKPPNISLPDAYSLPDLAEITRQTLHRSMLADCFALLESRRAVESGEPVDPDEVAALCHRIAVKARAFHQTLAMDQVGSGHAKYCIACGSLNVKATWSPHNSLDRGEVNIVCSSCGYHHEALHGIERGEFTSTRPLLVFLDQGSDDPDMAERHLQDCLALRDPRYLDVILPIVARIHGVTSELIQRVISDPKSKEAEQ